MPLILRPSIDDFNRPELEAYLEGVRFRRMLASTEYYQGKNAKLSHESDKIQRQMRQHLTMLERELTRLEKADHTVQKRLDTLHTLQTELGVVTDMISLNTVSDQADQNEEAT